jgi:hypothetical protein
MRCVYHASQGAEIVAASCHAQTVAPQKRNCNRLLFFINASLGHYLEMNKLDIEELRRAAGKE